MKFTDIFVKKPVLALVVSLFILLFGLRAITDLNVRQYPELRNAVINVSTTYFGADANLIQGFITTPLEREVASAEGIDYITSSSSAGVSSIQAYIRLDQDPNEALTQIAAKVNKLRSQLPPESEDPVIELQQGEQIAAMYVSFASERLSTNQITDYLTRVVEPKLATIPGVQRADILGAGAFAMRVWLKPDRMTALEVTGSDVAAALQSNNVLSALGSTKGQMVAVDLTARTDLRTPEEFRNLVVREADGAIVRLGDVADVELGSESYGSSVRINGDAATFMGIFVSPEANSLDVIKAVREVWDSEIVPQLPEGITASIPYDSTEAIQDAIDEVVTTIVEAVIIVIVVIFLFLGSLRSVLIPAVAVPLSLIGSMFLMLLMGFSINLLTLLAMVLAIGIVVDDAIIVLENIHRHIEDGMSPTDAALLGARELAWPVVAMTTTLVAVYLPIGFQGGLTGVLFTEFAFTLAGSVLLSGVIALTLTPMMCAKILKPHSEGSKGKLESWLDDRFEWLRHGYQRKLHGALETKGVIAVFGAIVFVSCIFLYMASPKEPAPAEDQGFVFAIASADPYATLDYVERYTEEVTRIAKGIPEIENYFLFNGGFGGGASNSAIGGFVMKPWSERERSTKQVLEQDLQPQMAQVTGLNIFALIPPALPSAGGDGGGEFVIGGIGSLEQLQEVANGVMDQARASGRFIFLDSDLKIDKPRIEVQIDRDKAATLGIDMQTLAADMAALLSGGYANRFAMENRSYRVIPQVQRSDRLNAEQLGNFYTRTRDGELIPLSTLVKLEETAQPQTLKRFQQLNAVGITFAPRPGVSKGEALAVLEEAAAEVLPRGYSVDYAGESRQFKTEGSAMLFTLLFALVIIFLVLSAQFESFRDALIMLITVPMAICGALLVLNVLAIASGILGFGFGIEAFPGMSINIYTQVGLVTLIGVIAKHGILIVEFANKLQLDRGLSKREAIEEATSIRLRPVLMTTAALVFAMIPLLIADGPGAAARFSMGMVIASGMTIGTAFTLFVLPAFYLYLARDHSHDRARSVDDDGDAVAAAAPAPAPAPLAP